MKKNDANKRPIDGDGSGTAHYAVPHYIRTQRTLPRIIAGITVFIWLAAAGLGSNALAKREARNTSPMDELLRKPESSWGISFETRSDAPCAGIISAQFNPGGRGWPNSLEGDLPEPASGNPYLRFNGAFRFLLLGRDGVATFDFDSAFSSLSKLTSFDAKVTAGSGKLLLKAPADNSLIHITVQTEAGQRKISLARPEPIHLIEKKKRFALRLPPQLAAAVRGSQQANERQSGFHFRELAADEIAECRGQVWGKEVQEQGSPIDLSRYVALLTTGTKDFLAEQLTPNKKDNHDQTRQP